MTLPASPVIGLLHPGEMGAAVGQCLTGAGRTVLWASEGRSSDTAARAAAAGLTDAETAVKVAAQADLIVSVCPPHAALDTAWGVQGFRGLYLDANAISPDTARQVAGLITGGGGRYADGSIIGPPPEAAGSSRLYVSGEHADDVLALFAGTALEARLAGSGSVAASAVKMAYAAWAKGSSALALAARALGEAEGVADALTAEWALSQPDLADRCERAAAAAAAKGWRWAAEMEEIADTMAAAGLPDGFHQAAAEVYRRSPRQRPGTPTPPGGRLAWVLAALTGTDQD